MSQYLRKGQIWKLQKELKHRNIVQGRKEIREEVRQRPFIPIDHFYFAMKLIWSKCSFKHSKSPKESLVLSRSLFLLLRRESRRSVANRLTRTIRVSNNIKLDQHVNRNKFASFLPLDTLQIAARNKCPPVRGSSSGGNLLASNSPFASDDRLRIFLVKCFAVRLATKFVDANSLAIHFRP